MPDDVFTGLWPFDTWIQGQWQSIATAKREIVEFHPIVRPRVSTGYARNLHRTPFRWNSRLQIQSVPGFLQNHLYLDGCHWTYRQLMHLLLRCRNSRWSTWPMLPVNWWRWRCALNVDVRWSLSDCAPIALVHGNTAIASGCGTGSIVLLLELKPASGPLQTGTAYNLFEQAIKWGSRFIDSSCNHKIGIPPAEDTATSRAARMQSNKIWVSGPGLTSYKV